MAQYIYSNNGLNWRGASDSYVPVAGEVAFPDLATAAQLRAAFPGYDAAVTAAAAPDVLAGKIAAGITITSTSNPTNLSAVYALDSDTLNQIGSVARDVASGLGMPGGGTTFSYPDIHGSNHTFTASEIINLYKAQRDLLLNYNTQEAIQAAGGSASYASASVTIP